MPSQKLIELTHKQISLPIFRLTHLCTDLTFYGIQCPTSKCQSLLIMSQPGQSLVK